jgi:hypothetical protein
MTVKKILAQRQKTHGKFSTHAEISQKLKAVMREHGLYELEHDQIEALEMVAHKIARVLNGNPNHRDHWDDIAGYATLIAEEL